MAEQTDRYHRMIEELGLGNAQDVCAVTPLTGGVSSDIVLVDLPNRKVCIKFALERLNVAAEWHAPLRRNSAEYRWLKFAEEFAPHNVPTPLGLSEKLSGFAMEYIHGADVRNWKADLLSAPPEAKDVIAVARLLGEIHARSIEADLTSLGFDNAADFEALRIEPYISSLIVEHPDLAPQLEEAADQLRRARIALVHGDVSPKNILFRGGHPIILDAECATHGDPVFDVAFMLNHLLLKAVFAPRHAAQFVQATRLFLREYLRVVRWEEPAGFRERLARLLPILFLARVDGKSPVEYLNSGQQTVVRSIARRAIADPKSTIEPLFRAVTGQFA